MRQLLGLGFVVVLTAVAGCGSGNKAKAEKLNREIIAEMKSMVGAFESGDKASVDRSFDKIQKIVNENRSLKITKSEADSLKGLEAEIKTVAEQCVEAMKRGMAAGKWKPADLMEIGQKFTTLGSSMK
jgi:hypothetical protein